LEDKKKGQGPFFMLSIKKVIEKMSANGHFFRIRLKSSAGFSNQFKNKSIEKAGK